MSNAPSKPVSFSRPKVGYFSNRPRMCNAVSHTLDAGLLGRSQNPEGPATGHPGTSFSSFPCV